MGNLSSWQLDMTIKKNKNKIWMIFIILIYESIVKINQAN